MIKNKEKKYFIVREKFLKELALRPKSDNLFFVEAKQGQGKSIAVSQYLESSECIFLWYDLSSSDKNFLFFIENLSRKIEEIFPAFSESSVFKLLINNQIDVTDADLYGKKIKKFLALSVEKKDFCIVFDNIYLVDSSEYTLNFINNFLYVFPGYFRTFLISRSSIHKTLKSDIIPDFCFYGKSLELDFNEAKELSEIIVEKDIYKEQINKLLRESEGWTTGFIFKLYESMGYASYIDAFSSIFLKDLSHEMLKALMIISYFDSIDSSFAVKISGSDNIITLLDSLVDKRHFVRRTGKKNIEYKLHYLFQKVLQKNINNYFSEYDEKKIIYKIIDVLVKEKKIVKAIEFIIRIQDYDYLEKIIEKEGVKLYLENKVGDFYELFKDINESILLEYGWCSLFFGISLLDHKPYDSIKYIVRSYELLKKISDVQGEILSLTHIVFFHTVISGSYEKIKLILIDLRNLYERYGYDIPVVIKIKTLIAISGTYALVEGCPDLTALFYFYIKLKSF